MNAVELLKLAWQNRQKIDLTGLLSLPPQSLSPYHEFPEAIASSSSLQQVREKVKAKVSVKWLEEPLSNDYGAVDFKWLVEEYRQNFHRQKLKEFIDETDSLTSVQAYLDQILSGKTEEITNLEDLKDEILDEYTNPEKIETIPFGYPMMDKFTLGMPKGQLTIVAAAPGLGKTTFALNVAIRSKKPTLFFSIEMTKRELFERVLSIRSGIPYRQIRSHGLTKEQLTQLYKTNIRNIYCDDSSQLTIGQIRSRLSSFSRKEDPGLVIVDYLQLMDDPTRRGESEALRIGRITYGLKAIAKDFNVPMILISQLNRDYSKRTDKRPKMSDLRESGAIEQAAYMVIFLHRDDYFDFESMRLTEEDIVPVELIVGKNRGGGTGLLDFELNLPVFTIEETSVNMSRTDSIEI